MVASTNLSRRITPEEGDNNSGNRRFAPHIHTSSGAFPSLGIVQTKFSILILVLFSISLVAQTICAQVATRASAEKPGAPSGLSASPIETNNVLSVGQPLRGALHEGESRVFKVPLKVGQYAKIAFENQSGFFIVLALDPSGKPIGKINFGGDSIWLAAGAAGTYQIKVSVADFWVSRGQYAISVEKISNLEAAPSFDLDHLKAHDLLFKADQLLSSTDDKSLHDAIGKFEAALQLWRNLGARAEEAHTLHQLASAYETLTDREKALESNSRALSIWQTLSNHELDAAATLYNMGTIYAASGKTDKAIDCYQRAIANWRSKGEKNGLAITLNNLGQVYINIGEFQSALKAHQEALSLRREFKDILGEAKSLSNIGGVYFRSGELQEALNYSLQSLPIRRVAGDRRGEAVTISNIGTIYRELGETQEAIRYYQQALSFNRASVDESTNLSRSIIDGMGECYFDLGDYSKALELYTKSLSLMPTPKNPYEEGLTLTHIGNAYASMGNREKALEYFEQALQLQREIKDRRGQALTLQKAGEVYQWAGDLKKARGYFDEGLALSRSIQSHAFEANLLYDIALNERLAGNPMQARAHVEAAIDIVESARAVFANSDLRASFLASKQEFYELDIDLLMQKYLQDRDQQSLLQAFSISEKRRARSLLDSLESERGTILGGVSSGLIARESELRAKLNQKAESQIKLLSGEHTQEQADVLAQEVERANIEYEQFLAKIKISDSRYARLKQSTSLSVRELQTKLLSPDTLLLEFSLGKERSYLWTVSTTDVEGYELPGRADIEAKARNIYNLLTARDRFIKFEKPDHRQSRIAKADTDYVQAASRLSKLLLGPVASQLENKHLIIISDGALQYLPFAALPSPLSSPKSQTSSDGYRPLIADHEISNLPSASILSLLRQELSGRRPAPKGVAVIADPVFSKHDERVLKIQSAGRAGKGHIQEQKSPTNLIPDSQLVRAVRDLDAEGGLELDRLPSTRREAEAILRLVPSHDKFSALDFDADRSVVTNPKLAQYRIVHFATHGLLNSAHPGLSGLIFSLVDRQGRDQNGFLTTQDIFNLKLPADLIVLSGCRTGLGKEIKGEGMLGLTRAFMYAGAARLVVSLWDVNDDSTAELMARFYNRMLGKKHLSPSGALREAQGEMWKSNRWRAPYYWAGFVIEGEYR